MIQYCLSYMWLFHQRLPNAVLSLDFNEQVRRSGNPLTDRFGKLLAVPVPVPERGRNSGTITELAQPQSGEMHFRWRELSEAQKNSHDNHPAIDLVADEEALQWFSAAFFSHLQPTERSAITAQLTDFRLRLTDYQFLNVLVLFATDSLQDFEALVNEKIHVIRNINPIVRRLEKYFSLLEDNGYALRTEDYFGIPVKLNVDVVPKKHFLAHLFAQKNAGFAVPHTAEKLISLCYDDMYQYDEPVLLTSVHANDVEAVQSILTIQSNQKDSLADTVVYGINEEPPVFTFAQNLPLPPMVVSEYIEPMNLLLAERCVNESTAQIFYAIVELINEINALENKGRKTAFDVQKMRRFAEFKEEDLRLIILKLALVLDKCVIRKSSLTGWQNDYIKIYKSNLGADKAEDIERARERNRTYDRLLSIYLDNKEQQRQSKHSRRQEAVLGLFTFLTIFSVFIDVTNFLEQTEYDTWNIEMSSLEVKMFISVVLCVTALALFFFRSRHR